MKVTVMPIVTGGHGNILKDLVMELEELEIGGQLRASKLQHC